MNIVGYLVDDMVDIDTFIIVITDVSNFISFRSMFRLLECFFFLNPIIQYIVFIIIGSLPSFGIVVAISVSIVVIKDYQLLGDGF